MTDLTFLKDIVVILAVAVAVVSILRRLGVPSIAGFVLSGVIIGPNALGLVSDVHQVELLAEIGVVLLLFGIGLELSLERMRRLWRLIVFGGAIQVGVTIAVTMSLATLWDVPVRTGAFLGCVAAVSSTAIVLTGLRQRGEIDAPHGRLTLGILVFQDLCVVPMLMVVPLLAGTAGSDVTLLLQMLKAIGVVVAVLVAARLIVPRLLEAIVRTRQRELFVVTVFLICIGTAWAVASVGVSLALGAFLGGLVVASSRYSHQALSDIIPFREVLASIFFVSVGMLLDPIAIAADPLPVMLILLGLIAGKFFIVFVTAAVLRLPTRVAVLAGASLAQVGEFSFVLAGAAEGTPLLIEPLWGYFLAAVILSMLVTPLIILAGPHLAAGAGRLRPLIRLLDVRAADDLSLGHGMRDHVIIAGYGLTGQDLAHSLAEIGIPYVVADLNSENVRSAIRNKVPAYYGDVTSPEVLAHLGIEHARELVLVINDPDAAVRTILAARSLAPKVPILVRAQYAVRMAQFMKAGADDVVAAEIEASAEVTARVCRRYQVRSDEVDPQVERIRARVDEEEEEQKV